MSVPAMTEALTCANTKATLGAADTRLWIESVLLPLDGELAAAGFTACVPGPLLPMALDLLAGSGIHVGTQDVWYEPGGYTGESPATLIRELGATHTMIGHAERRARGESDALIARKLSGAHSAGLTPILCLGEREELTGRAAATEVCRQYDAATTRLPATPTAATIVLYEPAWAIGGQAARPAHVATVCAALRGHAAERSGEQLSILYGGGVGPDTCAAMLDAGAPIAGVGLGRVVYHRDTLATALDAILHAYR